MDATHSTKFLNESVSTWWVGFATSVHGGNPIGLPDVVTAQELAQSPWSCTSPIMPGQCSRASKCLGISMVAASDWISLIAMTSLRGLIVPSRCPKPSVRGIPRNILFSSAFQLQDENKYHFSGYKCTQVLSFKHNFNWERERETCYSGINQSL